MRPFKLFFGIAIATFLFFFVAKIAIMAFIFAAIMSIIYATFRRIKDFITYDRFGEPYISEDRYARMQNPMRNDVEPLFYNNASTKMNNRSNVQFIKAL